jgi:hypothetical protein
LFAASAEVVLLMAFSILSVSLFKNAQLADAMARPLIKKAQRCMDGELHRLFDPII